MSKKPAAKNRCIKSDSDHTHNVPAGKKKLKAKQPAAKPLKKNSTIHTAGLSQKITAQTLLALRRRAR
ncbi:MAG: hypothetical protein CMM16_01500 [Rhodospirillaceae bacterium]|nr:hypothetical protein [Rhodospirillaceae bacterium]